MLPGSEGREEARFMPMVLTIAAAFFVRADGCTLLVRKRGTTTFMQPGGKINPGETAKLALVRELEEELGLTVSVGSLTYLGRYSAPAANEPAATVDAELFKVVSDQDVSPAAEIEEIAWIADTSSLHLKVAPLTQMYVLPLHRRLWNRLADGSSPVSER
jgi:8-oxo-dGTP diphosphatase